ncbi:hypothetical protein [Jannaschia sp. M317]|uniref:hypothetical protein n=1 Tax=Jannaschia sp. M317 TaxID=2867011 RepID=UPI0021A40084|nr:hypothetical protein [Jannaschia sp. M317]UWQ19732.1 hypothetical protein K3551_18890 [Jannaschia sp. M317]
MIRKVPQRTGIGVSNADRHARAETLAVSAAKYMEARPVGEEAKAVPKVATETPPPQTIDVEGHAQPTSKPEVKPEPTPNSKAAPKARKPRRTRSRAVKSDSAETETAGQGGEKPAFHMRVLLADTARIDDMAEVAGVSVAYIQKALQKAVLVRMRELRDADDWSSYTDLAAPRLEDSRGEGPAFGRTTMNLSVEQVREVHKGIHDPLRIHSTGQVLSAFARVLLVEELDALEKRIDD